MAIAGGAAARAIASLVLLMSLEVFPYPVLAETEESAADKGDPFDKICRAVERASAENDLPVEFFTRLIWQESKFETRLVSHKGARGIAQFMPATAAWRGLRDPFEPVQSLKESASYLRELFITFGNLGLAAAAYNAGPGRISNWLAGKARLPDETKKYVEVVTGRPIQEWASSRPPRWAGAEVPKDVPCDELATLITASRDEAKVRPAAVEQTKAAPSTSEEIREVRPAMMLEARDPGAKSPEPPAPVDIPADSSAPEPQSWGVQLAGSWEEGHVLASFERVRRQFPEIIGEHQPLVLKQQSAMGRASRYVVRITEASRQSAEALCDRLRAANGACLVLANPPRS